jgi:hypothetical protein
MAQQKKDLVKQSVEDRRKAKEKSVVDETTLLVEAWKEKSNCDVLWDVQVNIHTYQTTSGSITFNWYGCLGKHLSTIIDCGNMDLVFMVREYLTGDERIRSCYHQNCLKNSIRLNSS